jgi:hypothetical protein
MSTKPGFAVVDEQEAPKREAVATNLLLLSLKTLAQRTVVAVADLFTLLTVTSAWTLWYINPNPNTLQIVSLSIYAVFVVAVNVIVRSHASRK